MKRVVLVFASLLIGLTTASATETNTHKPNIKLEKRKSNHLSQPITFKENGVEFLIFSDGSFDFNAKHTKHFNPLAYKRNTYRNTSYRGPNANVQYTRFSNKGLTITHDRFGKIKRIGHVNINYDRYGRITRAGTVNMSYSRNKHTVLTKVGGLKVVYNRKGQIVKTRGQVKHYVKTRHNKKYKR
ncbi:hypothetical protein FPF71_06865 [Algibacter amylolyticus]|uniref:Uncharacterized protein n=1 Tax=Algibacter amylolyticus TaxID=1608400 RepID=A0A5M7B7T5_9FLAO|nr:hypothetical protein [Algibacter amylolyticus]KAA5825623.1 hypothetical protein F2B50_06865 [Algibacter amylolyticus]MBB5268149.1 hypothetical protein [Algibacter amylolyticus]TSJ79921.1 hypothetical protein FPF71_06865 [Algibacter amylolyticus]